jgi:hypothetical protein
MWYILLAVVRYALCTLHIHIPGCKNGYTLHVLLLAVERDTPCNCKSITHVCGKVDALHVHTAGSGNGYSLHVHTAGCENGYTLHVQTAILLVLVAVEGIPRQHPNCRYWKVIHPARLKTAVDGVILAI